MSCHVHSRRSWRVPGLLVATIGAQLALDGTLFHQDTERVDLQQILDELKQRGIDPSSAIPEDDIRQQWYPRRPSGHWDTQDTSGATQLSLF